MHRPHLMWKSISRSEISDLYNRRDGRCRAEAEGRGADRRQPGAALHEGHSRRAALRLLDASPPGARHDGRRVRGDRRAAGAPAAARGDRRDLRLADLPPALRQRRAARRRRHRRGDVRVRRAGRGARGRAAGGGTCPRRAAGAVAAAADRIALGLDRCCLCGVVLHLEGGAATAGRDDVRVVDLEAGALEAFDVVDLGAEDELHADFVDDHGDAAHLEDVVVVLGAVEGKRVLKARAAAAADRDAERLALGIVLPSEQLGERGIETVSLYVSVDGRQEPESEIPDYADFYQRLRASEEGATTSQPSIGDFVSVYEPLLEAGREIVSVHISAGISGTCEAASQARDRLVAEDRGGERIRVFDSRSAAGGMGLGVLAGTAAAAAGGDG